MCALSLFYTVASYYSAHCPAPICVGRRVDIYVDCMQMKSKYNRWHAVWPNM